YRAYRADGTGASPTAVQSGEEIGGLNAYGFSGSAYLGPLAYFRAYAVENFSTGHGGTKDCLATTPIASVTPADSFCQQNDGGVTIGSPTGGSQGAGTQNVATGYYVNGNLVGQAQPQGRLTL